MALTPEEQAELAELEALEAKQKGLDLSKLTPEEQAELKQLEAEESSLSKDYPVAGYREADLGAFNRARYSIEPIESNRKALLVQEFGPENVMELEGETYILQDEQWRPVNAAGVSGADAAELAGTLPEMLGAGAGAVVGLGPGSIPSAMLGASAGSAIRQGVSSLMGTPQVATGTERMGELAISAGTSGVLAGLGKVGKWGLKKAVKKARKALPGLDISDDGRKIIEIAKKQGLPEPTSGQKIGGRTLELEKALGEKRFFGSSIRARYEQQAEQIKQNLKNFAGDFIEVDSPMDAVGKKAKDKIITKIESVKRMAQDGFDDAVRAGREVTVGAKDVKLSLIDNFKELGVMDSKGRLVKHSSRTGLTADQFKRLQKVAKTLMDDVETFAKTPKDVLIGEGEAVIDANAINTMRKFVDANIREGQKLGYDDALLIRLKNSLLQTTEDMLFTHSKEAGESFASARYAWHQYKTLQKAFSKGGKTGLGLEGLADEKVVKKIFTDSENVKKATQFFSKEEMDALGVSYVHDILTKKLGGADQVGAQGALTMIRRSKPQLVASIGEASYNNLRDNLHFLAKIGKPINPSKTAIMSMRELSIGNFIQGLAEAGELTARRLKRGGFESLDNAIEWASKNKAKGIGLLQGLSDESQMETIESFRAPSAPKIPYRRY